MQKKPARRRTTTAKRRTPTRRRRPRKKGLLSELVTERTAQAGIRTIGSGAIGGAGANLLQSVMKPQMPTNMKLFWTAAAAFGVATVGKMPMVGAGMAGVAGFQLLSEVGGLNDDTQEYMYAMETQQLPDMLDPYGRPMVMGENGDLYLAEDLDLAEDQYSVMPAASYEPAYAPSFSQY